jgi:hypothetical protein
MLALKSRDDIFSLHAAAVVSAELLLTSITMYLCISLAYTNAPCVCVCVEKKNYKFFKQERIKKKMARI